MAARSTSRLAASVSVGDQAPSPEPGFAVLFKQVGANTPERQAIYVGWLRRLQHDGGNLLSVRRGTMVLMQDGSVQFVPSGCLCGTDRTCRRALHPIFYGKRVPEPRWED